MNQSSKSAESVVGQQPKSASTQKRAWPQRDTCAISLELFEASIWNQN